jgi:hypothetical protein
MISAQSAPKYSHALPRELDTKFSTSCAVPDVRGFLAVRWKCQTTHELRESGATTRSREAGASKRGWVLIDFLALNQWRVLLEVEVEQRVF